MGQVNGNSNIVFLTGWRSSAYPIISLFLYFKTINFSVYFLYLIVIELISKTSVNSAKYNKSKVKEN